MKRIIRNNQFFPHLLTSKTFCLTVPWESLNIRLKGICKTWDWLNTIFQRMITRSSNLLTLTKKTHYCDQKCRVYTVFKLSKTKNLDTIWIQFGYNHDKIWIKGHGQYQSWKCRSWIRTRGCCCVMWRKQRISSQTGITLKMGSVKGLGFKPEIVK